MPYRVFVVERSPTAVKAVEAALPPPEFAVRVFGDGPEAIAAILEAPPDVLVAGLSLPSRSGYEVTAVLRSREGGSEAAAFLLRGPFEPLDLAALAKVEIDGMIHKPFDSEAFAARVREAVDRRKDIPTIPEEPVLERPPQPEGLPEEIAPAGPAAEAIPPAPPEPIPVPEPERLPPPPRPGPAPAPAPAAPAEAFDFDRRVREIVREEILRAPEELEERVREIAASEYRRKLVEELKDIDDKI